MKAVVTAVAVVLCGLDHSTYSHADRSVAQDPAALVAEYVKRDAAGERLSANSWFADVVVWEDEPGFDSYAAITAYHFQPESRVADTSFIVVAYDRAGWIETTGTKTARFIRSRTQERHTFKLVLGDGEWLIHRPQMAQRVLVDAVLKVAPLGDADVEALKAAAASPLPPTQ